jgi:nucleotide-binding universal stress UspA family protein
MNVVVATDGSIEADIASCVLKTLPLPRKAKLYVAMVTPQPTVAGVGVVAGAGVAAAASNTWRVERDVAAKNVERVAQRWRERGWDAEPVVLAGDTFEEIVELVDFKGADAVLVGCGTGGNLRAFLLGSVSRKLVTYSPVSVLVGRPYPEAMGDACERLRAKTKLDLVVAVDGTEGAEIAVRSLERLSAPAFGTVHVVAVEPPLYEYVNLQVPDLPVLQAERQEWRCIAECAADRIRGCAERVIPVNPRGRPSEEIVRIAEEAQADLVMLGANRHGLLARVLVGSCAYEVATTAPCSVLILRDEMQFER